MGTIKQNNLIKHWRFSSLILLFLSFTISLKAQTWQDTYSSALNAFSNSDYRNAIQEGEAPPLVVQTAIDVAPIAVGANLILNNISFATSSDQLAPSSLLELDRVADFMQLNPTVSIEISAHSDDVGAAAFNQQLSQRRALSVEDYLIKKNIKETFMQSVGYGEERPIVANDSDENRAKNRRVELMVTGVN